MTQKPSFTRYLLYLAVMLPFLLPSCGGNSEETEKPNIVFILGDDMRLDDFGFINGKALTPHLDLLATEGYYFPRTYVPSAACTPTRFSCLTGRLASRCQSPSFVNSATPEGMYAVTWNTPLSHEPDILSRTLQDAGYVTGVVGKWHNGTSDEYFRIRETLNPDDDPSDPEVAARLNEMCRAMEEHLNTLGFDYAKGIVYGNYPNNPLKALHFHNQEVITKCAVDFITRNSDKPFFLYMPTTLMHGPPAWLSLQADPRKHYCGLLEEPLDVQPSREDVISRGREAGIEENRIPATWLDDGIGAVLQTLEDLGIMKNTMVVFMNDQGHDGGKGSCYEGGVRVPSIIYWPGIIEPGRSNSMVANIDLYPTILEACGVPYDPAEHDGLSLWPIINGEKEHIRDLIYCEWAFTRAIVTEDWKYLAFRLPPSEVMTYEEKVEAANLLARRSRNPNYIPRPDAPQSHVGDPGGSPIEHYQGIAHYPNYYDADQLYHLENDSLEQVNLAGDPQYSDKLKELKAILSEWVKEMPGTFAEF